MAKKNKNINEGNIEAGQNVHIGDNIYQNTASFTPRKILTKGPADTPVFIGRKGLLKNLTTRLYSEKEHFLLLMNGEGGIGKTTLAAKYWHQELKNYYHLIWLYVEEGIAVALLSLSEVLGITFNPQNNQQQNIEQLLEILGNLPSPSLLVLDNANNKTDLLKHNHWLSSLSNFHIIITTRVQEAGDMPALPVNTLAERDAIELFQYYYPWVEKKDQKLLQSILHAIGFNTLVIEVLAKNMHELNQLRQAYSLQDLHHDLQEKGLLLIKGKKLNTAWGGPQLAVATPTEIIQAMYDINTIGTSEVKLLKHMSLLPPDNISFSFLAELLQPIEEEAIEASLNNLLAKGWISFLKKEKTTQIKISPVIQSIIQNKYEETIIEDCLEMIGNINNTLKEENLWIPNRSSTDRQELVLIGEQILNYIKRDRWQKSFIAFRLGDFYEKIGNFDQAIEKFMLSANIFKNIQKVGDYATSLARVGIIQTKIGQIEEALKIFQEYNMVFRYLLQEEPNNSHYKIELTISYEKLGDIHRSLGKFDKALYFFQKRSHLSQELCREFPNQFEFKNNLATSYERLGDLYQKLNKFDKALHFFQKESSLCQELYKEFPNRFDFKNHLAISYEKLGDLYQKLGNLKKALYFFELDCKLTEELHMDFPNRIEFKSGLAIAYEKLGGLYQNLNNLDKALYFFRKRSHLSQELYKDFPNQVEFKSGLAVSYERLGDLYQKLDEFKKALHFLQKREYLGLELYIQYPNQVEFKNGLAISYSRLGNLHQTLGDKKKSCEYFKKAEVLWLALCEQVDIPEYRDNLGWVQTELENCS